MLRFLNSLKEFISRLKAAWRIVTRGDALNGNISRLKKSLIELDYIITHASDLSKDQILDFLSNPDGCCDTGMRHHLSHILTSTAGWHQLYMERQAVEDVEAEARRRLDVHLDGSEVSE